MPLVNADRVREITTTQGTGTIITSGAVRTYRTFADGVGTGNSCYYALVSRTTSDFEVGIGTVTVTGGLTYITRDTVLTSSNGNALVDFGSEQKEIGVVFPAQLIGSIANNVSAAEAAATNASIAAAAADADASVAVVYAGIATSVADIAVSAAGVATSAAAVAVSVAAGLSALVNIVGQGMLTYSSATNTITGRTLTAAYPLSIDNANGIAGAPNIFLVTAVPVSLGGTGASIAADARTNLGAASQIQVDAVSAAVSVVQTQVNALSATVSANAALVTALSATMATSIGTVQTQVNALSATVSADAATVTALSATMATSIANVSAAAAILARANNNFTGNITVSGTFQVSGAVSLKNGIDVSGVGTFRGQSNFIGLVSASAAQFTGPVSVNNNFVVLGSAAFGRAPIANMVISVSGGVAMPFVSLTDATSIAVDFKRGNNFEVLISAASRTLEAPTNATVGQSGFFSFIQNSGGTGTLAFNSVYKLPSTPTMSTSANSCDIMAYYVRSATSINCLYTNY